MGEFNVDKTTGSLEQTAGMPSEYPASQVMMSDGVTSVEEAIDDITPRTVTGTTLAQLVTAIGKLSEEQKSRCTIKIGANIIRQYYGDSSGTEGYHYTQTESNGRCYEVRLLIQPSGYIYKEYEVNGTSMLLDRDITVTSWTIYYQGTPIS